MRVVLASGFGKPTERAGVEGATKTVDAAVQPLHQRVGVGTGWAKCSFVASSKVVADEVIMESIGRQDARRQDNHFQRAISHDDQEIRVQADGESTDFRSVGTPSREIASTMQLIVIIKLHGVNLLVARYDDAKTHGNLRSGNRYDKQSEENSC